ncbi:MAG: CBS domain-containing protein [Ginsengibacter sp.]
MTTLQITDTSIPPLKLDDTSAKALQLMSEYKVSHLPVVDDQLYLGLISKDDLAGKNDSTLPVEFFRENLLPASVNEAQHFLNAVAVYNLYRTNLIPVINDSHEFVGAIHDFSLIKAMGDLCGANEFGALVVFEIEATKLSISEINGIVESDGAIILHLNIYHQPPSPLLQVTLQINKREISTIIASFERYEYSVLFYSGEELFENEISSNYQNLMNYLDI